MSDIATNTLSSRGQVVIPEGIRTRLGLEPGTQFVVIGDGDVLVLKAIQRPSIDEFDTTVARAREAARRAGLRKTDLERVIAKARHGT